MATPPISETPEVEQHYLAQFAIIAGLSKAAQQLWPLLDPENLTASFNAVERGLVALVERYSSAAISVAADHYDDLRAEFVAGAAFSAAVIDPPSTEAIRDAVDLIVTPKLDQTLTVPDPLYLAEITTQVIHGADVAAQGLVADSASDEIFEAISRDRRAKGWARVTRPGACYFCRLLATRGAVYRTQKSASFRAHVPKDGRGGVCRCQVEPLFGKYYEMTARARADLETYERVKEGLSGADVVYEFRRAVEGREDGPRLPRGKRGRKRTRKGKPEKAQPLGFKYLTPAQLQHQLSVLEPLPDSDYRTEQIERVRNRLADLGA
jgi:hypothetical protein